MRKVIAPLLCGILIILISSSFAGCSPFTGSFNDCVEKINSNSSQIDYTGRIAVSAMPLTEEGLEYKKLDIGDNKYEEYFSTDYTVKFTNVTGQNVAFGVKAYLDKELFSSERDAELVDSSAVMTLKPGQSYTAETKDKAFQIVGKPEGEQLQGLLDQFNLLYVEMSMDGKMAYAKIDLRDLAPTAKE